MIKIIKNPLVFLLCLGLSGCAYYLQYSEVYKKNLKAATTITITKEGNYQELRQKITGYFESQGYKNILYVDQKKGFVVLAKECDFGKPCQIILKYTVSLSEDKIRIDLVKASDEIITDSEVSTDIQRIADQIKNN